MAYSPFNLGVREEVINQKKNRNLNDIPRGNCATSECVFLNFRESFAKEMSIYIFLNSLGNRCTLKFDLILKISVRFYKKCTK